ncbi:MAG: enoyl-CoA hydratase/isomerase family protein [Candidatus Zixiibacteriota bacterium]
MSDYQTIRVEQDGFVRRITLARPDVRNAFNEQVIDELTRAFTSVDEEVRVVVLAGDGKTFSAGADINWMKKSASYTEAENARDASAMRAMFVAIDECRCPVIVRVHGAALGGGVGLVAAGDIVVAADDTKFGFTEVRLGIVPAVISPFALRKIGVTSARRYFITGEIFKAEEARHIGLIHEIAPADQLDAKIESLVQAILQVGPRAAATAKELIRQVTHLGLDNAAEYTVSTIAKVRTSSEGQEGLGAFLEKRQPNWI